MSRSLSSWKVHAKRGFDVCAAMIGLTATAPLMLAAACAIWITMGSPVLFWQERPGLHGKPFRLAKFRTMREPAPGEARYATDGMRLTRMGRLLRAASIDELPTFINVLKGDMSLVGPRPLLMDYLARYSPEQARRHEVKPGITGLAQVRGRNALTWEQKFALDVWYVDHWTFGLDLRILAETVVLVLRGSGVGHGGHPTMPEFLGSEGNEAGLSESSS